jgi:uncharacterized protein YqeY
MREQIMNDLKTAMKNQNKELLNVIRMVKGAIQLEEINVKHELTDEEMVSLISKQIKSRKETIDELKNSNRSELLEKTEKEIEILSKYMPKMMEVDEINKVIDEVFELVKPVDSKDMGKVMGKINPMLKGKADMSLVSKLIKERLS